MAILGDTFLRGDVSTSDSFKMTARGFTELNTDDTNKTGITKYNMLTYTKSSGTAYPGLLYLGDARIYLGINAYSLAFETSSDLTLKTGANGDINIDSGKALKLTSKKEATLKSTEGSVTLSAAGDNLSLTMAPQQGMMQLKAPNMNLTATNYVAVSGTNAVTLNSSNNVELTSGNTLTAKATGAASLTGYSVSLESTNTDSGKIGGIEITSGKDITIKSTNEEKGEININSPDDVIIKSTGETSQVKLDSANGNINIGAGSTKSYKSDSKYGIVSIVGGNKTTIGGYNSLDLYTYNNGSINIRPELYKTNTTLNITTHHVNIKPETDLTIESPTLTSTTTGTTTITGGGVTVESTGKDNKLNITDKGINVTASDSMTGLIKITAGHTATVSAPNINLQTAGTVQIIGTVENTNCNIKDIANMSVKPKNMTIDTGELSISSTSGTVNIKSDTFAVSSVGDMTLSSAKQITIKSTNTSNGTVTVNGYGVTVESKGNTNKLTLKSAGNTNISAGEGVLFDSSSSYGKVNISAGNSTSIGGSNSLELYTNTDGNINIKPSIGNLNTTLNITMHHVNIKPKTDLTIESPTLTSTTTGDTTIKSSGNANTQYATDLKIISGDIEDETNSLKNWKVNKYGNLTLLATRTIVAKAYNGIGIYTNGGTTIESQRNWFKASIGGTDISTDGGESMADLSYTNIISGKFKDVQDCDSDVETYSDINIKATNNLTMFGKAKTEIVSSNTFITTVTGTNHPPTQPGVLSLVAGTINSNDEVTGYGRIGISATENIYMTARNHMRIKGYNTTILSETITKIKGVFGVEESTSYGESLPTVSSSRATTDIGRIFFKIVE